ncbi:hypothetical protein [Paenibacillus sp. P22]|uniref:hypothetical protein n=1 Tax=Paenibacillus sp. P22 TaxID=483908 RepID=UPI000435480A|nr:hypothetical protein [Paenibacillus sp. P22]CDN44862.1 hypothetical protein BN871_FT_00140 [Paenibacillus sp. P22]
MSFTGSIIGGFVTLFGIRYTIKHQRKDDFIRSFPDRLVNADKIISEAYQLEEKLKELFDARKYKHYGVALHSFLKKEDILKRESAVVGVDYYNNLSYIFSLGKTIYEEISSYDIEDQELFTKCNYYINYLNAVNEKLYELKLGLEIRFAEINI